MALGVCCQWIRCQVESSKNTVFGTSRPCGPRWRKPRCGITRSRFRRWSKSVPPMCTPVVASTSSLRSARAMRSGPTRTTVKSEVPPPMSAMRISDSLRHALLVVEGGGDRFQLEADLAKARDARGCAQAVFGALVALAVVVDEVHRPADHGALGSMAQLAFGARGQLVQVARDDVLVAQHAVVHGRLLLHQRAAEQALERAHQPAFGAGEVQRDGLAAEVRAAVLGIEEEGGRHRRVAAFERQQPRRRASDRRGDGRVGSAEVDADGGGEGFFMEIGSGSDSRTQKSQRYAEVAKESKNFGFLCDFCEV